MKNLIKIILLIGLWIFPINLNAQNSLYIKTKEFKESEYTYQCDNPYGIVTLYNKANKYTYTDCTLKDGSPIPNDLDLQLLWGKVSTTEDDNWTQKKCYDIVENALSSYREQIKGAGMSVTMIISPETGKVIEVNFNFVAEAGFGTIPVSVFRKMEVELIKGVYFVVTEVGKKLNYCMISWTETY